PERVRGASRRRWRPRFDTLAPVKKLRSHGAQLIAVACLLVACAPPPHIMQNRSLPDSPAKIVAGTAAQSPALVYPVTARVQVSDRYSDTEVSDPYRWLENIDSGVTRQWVGEQNRLSQPRLDALPQRA